MLKEKDLNRIKFLHTRAKCKQKFLALQNIPKQMVSSLIMMMMFTYVNSFQVNNYFSWGINTKNLHYSLPVLSSSSAATPISTKSKDTGQQQEDFQASSPEEADAFSTLAFQSLFCLLQSDLKRKGGIDGGSTGWTS